MKVSAPLIAILALILYLAYRYMGLRIWQAILCLLFGFLIAATTAGPTVHQLLTAIVQWLNHP